METNNYTDNDVQLFKVALTNEIIVAAFDEYDALDLVEEALMEGMINIEKYAVEFQGGDSFPRNWDEACIPFGYRSGENEDRTITEWFRVLRGEIVNE